MIHYTIQLILCIWAAISVSLVARQYKYGLYIGMSSNLCFIAWWIFTQQHGFLVGDLMFTAIWLREIRRKQWVDSLRTQSKS